MTAELIEQREGTRSEVVEKAVWKKFDHTYECPVLICPEEEGGYSVHALRLPGVASQGEPVDEAVENIRDALQAAMQVYLEDSGSIPWCDNDVERSNGCLELRILVDV